MPSVVLGLISSVPASRRSQSWEGDECVMVTKWHEKGVFGASRVGHMRVSASSLSVSETFPRKDPF